MGVKVDDCDGSVRLVHRAQERKSYSVVTSHGNNTGQCLSVLGGAGHVCVCSRLAHQNTVVAFFNLLQGPLIVVTGHRNIATIDDSGPSVERVGLASCQYWAA
jgi:ActR/RegA family two-component response regulator